MLVGLLGYSCEVYSCVCSGGHLHIPDLREAERPRAGVAGTVKAEGASSDPTMEVKAPGLSVWMGGYEKAKT